MVVLLEFCEKSFGRGVVFRVNGKTVGDWVDLMIFENPDDDFPFGLIFSSGVMSGTVCALLPTDCLSVGGGVSVSWLVLNFKKIIGFECSLDNVYVLERYCGFSGS